VADYGSPTKRQYSSPFHNALAKRIFALRRTIHSLYLQLKGFT
jgi:hypothetical protein